ncbi:hypothetical protein BT63DRAFT_10582 [Microthyrium microscopicum]|uniref:Uncharacterized protein n=1 Tax=Microthyrium microscopicum TaxID=703497 RepID=A0A6A6UQA2_9PEZI|nr:hypothetical protein BT63DRAFT_10582 [Microthyrium microscopicum]
MFTSPRRNSSISDLSGSELYSSSISNPRSAIQSWTPRRHSTDQQSPNQQSAAQFKCHQPAEQSTEHKDSYGGWWVYPSSSHGRRSLPPSQMTSRRGSMDAWNEFYKTQHDEGMGERLVRRAEQRRTARIMAMDTKGAGDTDRGGSEAQGNDAERTEDPTSMVGGEQEGSVVVTMQLDAHTVPYEDMQSVIEENGGVDFDVQKVWPPPPSLGPRKSSLAVNLQRDSREVHQDSGDVEDGDVVAHALGDENELVEMGQWRHDPAT